MIKKIIFTIFIVLILVGTFFYLSKPPKTNEIEFDNPDLIFYWGDGCLHCENVEEWLTENNSNNILKISKKEVYQNRTNQTELYNLAKQYCPEIISDGSIGVPTGFDPVNNKCIQGDTPIIEFLSERLTN